MLQSMGSQLSNWTELNLPLRKTLWLHWSYLSNPGFPLHLKILMFKHMCKLPSTVSKNNFTVSGDHGNYSHPCLSKLLIVHFNMHNLLYVSFISIKLLKKKTKANKLLWLKKKATIGLCLPCSISLPGSWVSSQSSLIWTRILPEYQWSSRENMP